MPSTTRKDFVQTAAEMKPRVVGFTISEEAEAEGLAEVMARLRELPVPPRIILGGSWPHLSTLDPDGIASRFDTALLASRRILRS